MRALIISDIHANLTALEAVLLDGGKFDAVWCLGDLVGYGPDPNECVERIRSLPGLVCLQGNHDAALSNYYKALDIYNKTNNQKNLARVYHNIGMTYTDLQDWNRAIDSFKQCFSLADKVEDKQVLGLTYLNMGKAYARQGQLNKAMNQVHKALKVFRRMTDMLSMAEVYHVLGIIYAEKKDFLKAIDHINYCIDKNSGDPKYLYLKGLYYYNFKLFIFGILLTITIPNII